MGVSVLSFMTHQSSRLREKSSLDPGMRQIFDFLIIILKVLLMQYESPPAPTNKDLQPIFISALYE